MAKAKTEKAAETEEVKKTSTKTTKAPKTAKASKTVKSTKKVDTVVSEQAPEKASTKKTTKKTAKATEDSNTELQAKSKQEIIEMFATKDGDTGSPEVQIALTTQKIYNLSQHLKENPKDNHSRRGLLKIIAKRRRILNYLQEKNEGRYGELTVKLGLKK